MNLAGSTALVTGASRGLGAALARALAEREAKVVLVARDEAALDGVAAEIRRKGGTAIVLPGDIGDKDAIHGIAAAAAAVAGPVDLLVHNASILGRTPLRLLLDTDCEDLSRVLEVNLVGPFRLTKVIAGSMALRRSGLVLHVTSDASVNAYPSWGAYSVSKAALDHLGRVLAAELAGLGVKVLGVDPGEMRTRMHAEAMPVADPATLADPEEIAGRIVSMVEHADSLETGSRLEAPTWRPG
jgi:NAD(P)-dependent dehydrogenase (short-subunit alcohol dehydrogenase family)